MTFYLSYEQFDDKNGKTARRFELASADYATAVSDVAAYFTALAAVSDAGVRHVELRETIDTSDIAPAAGATVFERADLTVEKVNTEFANLEIPAPKASLFVPGTNTINNSDTDLGAYLALFQSGSFVRISDGEAILGVVRGKRSYARSGSTNLR